MLRTRLNVDVHLTLDDIELLRMGLTEAIESGWAWDCRDRCQALLDRLTPEFSFDPANTELLVGALAAGLATGLYEDLEDDIGNEFDREQVTDLICKLVRVATYAPAPADVADPAEAPAATPA